MLLLLAVGLAARAAHAQGVGNGISKATYATNDPTEGHRFLLKYLNVSNATDECAGDVCDCAHRGEAWEVQQGRVFTSTPGCFECEYAEFGLHLVNTSAHWTRGGLSVAGGFFSACVSDCGEARCSFFTNADVAPSCAA